MTGPFSLADIERRLGKSEIGMLHEIQYQGKWITLRAFFEVQVSLQKMEMERLAEEQRLAEEEAERQSQIVAKQLEQEKLDEQRRQNALLEQRASMETLPAEPGVRPESTAIKTLGTLVLIIGLLLAGYYFLLFDQSVPSGLGGRVNNLGLIADRQNGIIAGLGLCVVGAILYVFGNRRKP